jgi:hypothetical protein
MTRTPEIVEPQVHRVDAEISRFNSALSRLFTKLHGSEERAETTLSQFKRAFSRPNLLVFALFGLTFIVGYRSLRRGHAPALLDE